MTLIGLETIELPGMKEESVKEVTEEHPRIGLEMLPIPLLAEILDFISWKEGRRLLQSCRSLHEQKADIESKRRILDVQAADSLTGLLRDDSAVAHNLHCLLTVDLGTHATDEFFLHSAPWFRLATHLLRKFSGSHQ